MAPLISTLRDRVLETTESAYLLFPLTEYFPDRRLNYAEETNDLTSSVDNIP